MQWEGIDCILEATGAVEFATHVAMEGFKHKKHVIAMNAEMDGTIGPILKVSC
jgi:predicted homoserine dehydrogenase-like protein